MIDLQEKYKFRLSNGDWIEDKLINHMDLLELNGLDVIGCLESGRLVKLNGGD